MLAEKWQKLFLLLPVKEQHRRSRVIATSPRACNMSNGQTIPAEHSQQPLHGLGGEALALGSIGTGLPEALSSSAVSQVLQLEGSSRAPDGQSRAQATIPTIQARRIAREIAAVHYSHVPATTPKSAWPEPTAQPLLPQELQDCAESVLRGTAAHLASIGQCGGVRAPPSELLVRALHVANGHSNRPCSKDKALAYLVAHC